MARSLVFGPRLRDRALGTGPTSGARRWSASRGSFRSPLLREWVWTPDDPRTRWEPQGLRRTDQNSPPADGARSVETVGLRVNRSTVLPEDELRIEAARSGGPGGQNVNKVATKVVLRFRPGESRALDAGQKRRVAERLGHRLTREGEIVLHASRYRLRSRNLQDARQRLAELLAAALRPRPVRKATRPTPASRHRRLDAKRRRGAVKRARRSSGEPD